MICKECGEVKELKLSIIDDFWCYFCEDCTKHIILINTLTDEIGELIEWKGFGKILKGFTKYLFDLRKYNLAIRTNLAFQYLESTIKYKIEEIRNKVI